MSPSSSPGVSLYSVFFLTYSVHHHHHHHHHNTTSHPHTPTVWWAASTFYPVGAGHNIAPYTLAEVIFTMVFMALNVLMWGFILGSISLLVARSDEQSAKYRQRMVSHVGGVSGVRTCVLVGAGAGAGEGGRGVKSLWGITSHAAASQALELRHTNLLKSAAVVLSPSCFVLFAACS